MLVPWIPTWARIGMRAEADRDGDKGWVPGQTRFNVGKGWIRVKADIGSELNVGYGYIRDWVGTFGRNSVRRLASIPELRSA